jgi:hypothetical protein
MSSSHLGHFTFFPLSFSFLIDQPSRYLANYVKLLHISEEDIHIFDRNKMPSRMDSLRHSEHFSGVAKHAVPGELGGFGDKCAFAQQDRSQFLPKLV